MDEIREAKEEDRTRLLDELHAPGPRRNPEVVSQDVIDDEMSMFMNFSRQTSAGGV